LATTAALAAVLASGGRATADNLPNDKYSEWIQEREIAVPMRDGVHLSTTLVRQKVATAKLPTILVRSPYNDTSKLFPQDMWLAAFVRQGYAVVLEDQRGRGFSEGTQRYYLENAANDGADTIRWITQQPWSNGKVGALGCSISGNLQ